ncbi:MAG: hypothetical protein AOA65_0246 [Candidatus Bathyarchaeota archaeon BA1]|nr:MAG: hypothetical protein AOA65_0246 [Candidatus Bathyarchaeota archaeon BA1]
MPNSVEERLARVEGRLEELSKRLDDLNHSLSERIGGLGTSLREEIALTNKRIDDLRSEVRLWFVVITIVISLVTLLTRLIP